MSDVMIRVENLGKKYVIGHQAEGANYGLLRDVLAEGAKSLVKRFTGRSERRQTQEELWALRDVSFIVLPPFRKIAPRGGELNPVVVKSELIHL